MKKTCENCYYGGDGYKKPKYGKVYCKKRNTDVKCGKQRNNCKDFRTSPPADRPHISYSDFFRIGW